ncbi:MAG TPA: type II toxin-antitoxin system RelE/ParE family toxin [Chitinophagaceae bacterium]
MSFNIIPTPPFQKELKQLAKKYPSLKNDMAVLAGKLQEDPQMGAALGNNCYKIRMAISSKGKGKSGGARLITFVQVTKTTIFLLSIYDKADAANISDKELTERLKHLK